MVKRCLGQPETEPWRHAGAFIVSQLCQSRVLTQVRLHRARCASTGFVVREYARSLQQKLKFLGDI